MHVLTMENALNAFQDARNVLTKPQRSVRCALDVQEDSRKTELSVFLALLALKYAKEDSQ